MSAIATGIIGSSGRMGTTLVEYLQGIGDISVAAKLEAGEDLAQFLAAAPAVVVDLSLGTAVAEHGEAIVQAQIPYVIGATGISPTFIEELGRMAVKSGSPVLVVPNFSLGASLMVRFAASAAKLMEAPVITERHHAAKADAPSGTAKFTAQRINEAAGGRPQLPAEANPTVLGEVIDGVRVHSIRGAGYLAEQEVRLSLPGETLTVEHRSIDRRCFMPGIEYAIRNVHRVQGLQVGLDTILEV